MRHKVYEHRCTLLWEKRGFFFLRLRPSLTEATEQDRTLSFEEFV